MNIRNEDEMAAKVGIADVAEAWALRFDRFVFDLRRGEVRDSNGIAVPLRPKAELLLRQFLSRPGRLLSKEELIAAVWPHAVVTDDSLVQCVGELRAALADSEQRLICTVPRRGYRFEASVELVLGVPPPSGPMPFTDEAGSTSSDPASTAGLGRRSSIRIGSFRSGAVVVLVATGLLGVAIVARMPGSSEHIDEELTRRHSIAVMRLAARPGDVAAGAMVDQVTEQIASQLSTHLGTRGHVEMTAASDAKSRSLGGKDSGPAIYAITGRIETVSAARFAIDVRAQSTREGSLVWSGHFDGSEGGGGRLASDIGQRVASALRRRLVELAAIDAERPDHQPDGADLVMLGWHDLDMRRSMAEIRRARERFRQAVDLDPDSVVAQIGLAASYLVARSPGKPWSQADGIEAERAVERVSRMAPNDSTVAMLWGDLQVLKGRPDLALPAFDKAIRLEPSFCAGYVLRAEALLLLGRVNEVQEEVDRAVQLAMAAHDTPRLTSAYLYAAEAALMRGEDAQAYEFARLAVSERPSIASPHAVLAAIDALAGRSERASAEMAEFRRLWPTATVASYDEARPSTYPAYLTQRARLYAGLRQAGLPER
jgi:DNA-binding winged helix-turn-helix (wHTH) protein/tetratricopeptide (TPR) repeat protein